MLLDELMQPLALASQHDYCGSCEVRFAVNLVAALVEPVNPEALFLKAF